MTTTGERLFRTAELVAYGALFLAAPLAKVVSLRYPGYATPLLFVVLAVAALIFMSRFFIYAYPEKVFDRTLARRIMIPRDKKLLLCFGIPASLTMLVLGCIGLVAPDRMERIISVISPMRFLLS